MISTLNLISLKDPKLLNLRKYSVPAMLSFAIAIAASPVCAAETQDVPTYAQPTADQEVHGLVTSYDGRYKLTVRDDRGFIDNVLLHQGTVINPTGLRLEQGMAVTIAGENGGSYFAANEVDTPYIFNEGVPYYRGHRWDYYYGPSYGAGFFFGHRRGH